MRHLTLLPLALTLACDPETATPDDGPELRCDGLDDDGDGRVDEGVLVPLFVDADLDGVGRPDTATFGCDPAAGQATIDGDCDDLDPDRYTGATEVCDGLDNDCDGRVDDEDDDVEGLFAWFPDLDGDGFGQAGAPLAACEAPAGFADNADDCDDDDDGAHPAGFEACDARDNDCDGDIDEDSVCGADCKPAHGDDASHPYLVCEGATDWIGARQRCAVMGYALVVIDDADENALVHSFGPDRAPGVWLGLTDAVREGDWQWVDRDGGDYRAWAGDGPSPLPVADCAALVPDRWSRSEPEGATWEARDCETPLPFVCEA